MKNIDYNFKNYMDDLSSIVYAIEKANVHYDVIVGVVRGGLIPAVHLSNIFDTVFVALNWSSNVSKIRDKENSIIHLAIERKQKILVVDDICDTGVSLDDITKVYKEVHTATLIHNNTNARNFTPTYFGWELSREDVPQWIDFWWEKK